MSRMHEITRPNGHLTSPLGRCASRSAATDVELRALRRRAWQETGVVVLRPEEVDDAFARQALINAAQALFGPRASAPDRSPRAAKPHNRKEEA
jgi:hypothetical protein